MADDTDKDLSKAPEGCSGQHCNGDGCQGGCSSEGGCQGGCQSGCCKRHTGGEPRCKLHSYNWLADIPGGYADSEWVEVTFKNTRKGYYKNSNNIPLEIGDIVAVEATPGHDIGTVTLTGILVEMRMKRARFNERNERRTRREKTEMEEVRRIFRKARPADLERYEEARSLENDTMIRARQIAADLGLNMKIGDVEYQGDGNKAIFYYISDERVDFRQLIKVLAETFKVRIEMKQIGARQEAGRIGGIGPCGRPLCCSMWMTNFVSVATSAARHQDLSLNPQKLAGQCAKLKCCLNFEVDSYVESSRGLPERNVRLETVDGTFYHFKTDVLKREITYSSDKNVAANLVTLPASRVHEIIAMNQRGEKPESLIDASKAKAPEKAAFGDILGDDDLTRFDKKKKKRRKNNKAPKDDATQTPAPPKESDGATAPAPAKRKKKKRPAKDNGGAAPQAPAQEKS